MPDKNSQTSKTYDNPALTKVTFQHHNTKTENEMALETAMTQKARVNTISEMRGGYPLTSLGDKIYKAVEYEKGFFM